MEDRLAWRFFGLGRAVSICKDCIQSSSRRLSIESFFHYPGDKFLSSFVAYRNECRMREPARPHPEALHLAPLTSSTLISLAERAERSTPAIFHHIAVGRVEGLLSHDLELRYHSSNPIGQEPVVILIKCPFPAKHFVAWSRNRMVATEREAIGCF